MELLRAYADKVASYLPKTIRQDTADELYDSLCEQFEDVQSAHEQASNEEDFLQTQPHPISMATQLSERESLYLIGPSVYLTFLEALKVSALVVAVLHTGIFALSAWSGGSTLQAFFQTLGDFFNNYLHVAVVVGLFFVVLEKTGQRLNWLDQWSVKDLKREADSQKISKFGTLFELNISVIVLLWFINVIQLPALVRHNGVWLSDLMAQIPDPLVTVMLVVVLVDIIVSVIKLFRAVWSPMLRLLAVVLDVIWIVLLKMLIQIDPFITQASAPDFVSNAEQVDDVLVILNQGMDTVFWFAIVIIAFDALSHILKLIRRS